MPVIRVGIATKNGFIRRDIKNGIAVFVDDEIFIDYCRALKLEPVYGTLIISANIEVAQIEDKFRNEIIAIEEVVENPPIIVTDANKQIALKEYLSDIEKIDNGAFKALGE